MPHKLLHRQSIPEQAIAADGLISFDLPTNPLSVILLTLRPLNDTGTLANFQRMMGLAGAINRVSVCRMGSAVFSMSGRDAVALNYFRHGIVPPQQGDLDTTNFRRALVVPLLMGRFAYDETSCLSQSRRGELTLELDFDIADTGYDGLRFSAETIELPGASPQFTERKVSIAQTFNATGDNDIQLPSGNILRGLLNFGTTAFTGATPVPSLGRMSLFMNGEANTYTSTDFEVASMLSSLSGRQPPMENVHFHRVDATSASTTEPTGGPVDLTSDGFENYAYLDLDPTRDDTLALDTADSNNLFLRSNAETADAVRVIPVERLRN